MSTAQARNRHVIARFLENLPENEGWWYRVPKLNYKPPKSSDLDPDDVMPHLGTLFGLTEDATAMILVEMGCLAERQHGSTTITRPQGWEDLASEFKVKSRIEIDTTQFNGKPVWFVRIGNPPEGLKYPSQIFRKYKGDPKSVMPPTRLGSRAINKFVTTELVGILKSSSLFDKLLKATYYDSDLLNKVGRNQRLIRAGLEKDSNSDESADKSTEEEENAQRTERTPSEWTLKQGTIPNSSDYPVLHQFGIPADNQQTIQLLLQELQKCQEKVEGSLSPGVQSLKTPNSLYVQVPQGSSRRIHHDFNNTVSTMIKLNSNEGRAKCTTRLLRRLDRESPDCFLQVMQERGYSSTQLTPKMSANLWTAMCEDANLQTGQQRIINSYLSYHFGKRVCVSEREITEVGSDYVPYVTANRLIEGQKKKILYSHRSAHDLFQCYGRTIFEGSRNEIDKLELLLGGDHGKGAFTFLFVIVVRYKDSTRAPMIVELQLGQIDSTEDSMELLRPLLDDMVPGLKKLMPSREGKSTVGVLNDDYELQFGEQNDDAIPMQFYLIGDLKFLFMMMGRSGFSGSYCLYCQLKQAEWKKQHVDLNAIDCGADAWTIEKLASGFLLGTQPDADARIPGGQKESPIWDFIPIECIIVPLLHILLGLSNDALSHFWDWLEERVEPLTADEIQARNMTLLAEIAIEEKYEELKTLKEILTTIVQERIDINSSLKQRGLETDVRNQLRTRKASILSEEVEARKNRDECDIQLKLRKAAQKTASAKETEVRKKRGQGEKPLRRGIEETIFGDYNVSMSSYHGGDMEGPSARRLMGDGEKIFPNIAEYIKHHLREQEDPLDDSAVDLVPLQIAEDSEIDAVCKDHGILFVLLDAIFSLLNTPRGKVTDDVTSQLESRLSGILTEWNRLGLSFTPKFHVLLNHSLGQLRRMKGFHDMGEDCIERSHQYRMRHEARLMRLRNKGLKMDSQAKFQGLKHIKEIQYIQAAVASNRKRKLTRKVPLADERKFEKKAKRCEKRNDVWELKQEEVPGEKVPAPRDRVRQLLKEQQE
jgi:hypothetical protein